MGNGAGKRVIELLDVEKDGRVKPLRLKEWVEHEAFFLDEKNAELTAQFKDRIETTWTTNGTPKPKGGIWAVDGTAAIWGTNGTAAIWGTNGTAIWGPNGLAQDVRDNVRTISLSQLKWTLKLFKKPHLEGMTTWLAEQIKNAAPIEEEKKEEESKEEAAEKDAAIRKVFDRFDTDENGQIDGKELVEFFKKLYEKSRDQGVSFIMKFEQFDHNNDGRIDFDEFNIMFRRMFDTGVNEKKEGVFEAAEFLLGEKEAAIRKVFNHFDVDENGHIDAKELVEFFKKLYEKARDQCGVCFNMKFDQFDHNKDGRIDFNEFNIMFRRMFDKGVDGKKDGVFEAAESLL